MHSLRLVAVAAFWIVAGVMSASWQVDVTAQARTAGAMADAANQFLASLTPEQRAKAVMRFDDGERFNWNERPLAGRKGIPLRELDGRQTQLAMALLKTGVGAAGYLEIQKIRSREPVLKEIRGPQDPNYPLSDSNLYYWSIFGQPSASSPWGWRVEGHHISVNVAVAAERSRKLFGSNLDGIAFAWSGGTQRGQWHYYTVQGSTFLIDYAQARDNETNHTHIIWRDFDDDFGD